MPRRGVEPPCLAAQDPKSCVYTISPPGHEAILPVNLTYSYKVVKLPSYMANQTPSPFSQQAEAKKDLSRAPGAMGWLNEIIGETTELIIEGKGNLVNERPTNPEQWIGPKSKGLEAGSITGFQAPRSVEKTDEQLLVEQRAAVAEAKSILKQSHAESVIQEEIRHEVVGMSEEDRNKRLRLNTSLRKEHTEDAYHMAELYRQIKGEVSTIEQQEKAREIPSPAKQPSAMEGAFEGRSGSQGGGTANLSNQAVG